METEQMETREEVRHLYRQQDPDTSKAAAESISPTAMEQRVLAVIKTFGTDGCISDDVRSHPSLATYSYSSVTARYKALMDKNLIFDTGRRKKGASGRGMRVMQATWQ